MMLPMHVALYPSKSYGCISLDPGYVLAEWWLLLVGWSNGLATGWRYYDLAGIGTLRDMYILTANHRANGASPI